MTAAPAHPVRSRGVWSRSSRRANGRARLATARQRAQLAWPRGERWKQASHDLQLSWTQQDRTSEVDRQFDAENYVRALTMANNDLHKRRPVMSKAAPLP